jgi:hypothetical protein
VCDPEMADRVKSIRKNNSLLGMLTGCTPYGKTGRNILDCLVELERLDHTFCSSLAQLSHGIRRVQ